MTLAEELLGTDFSKLSPDELRFIADKMLSLFDRMTKFAEDMDALPEKAERAARAATSRKKAIAAFTSFYSELAAVVSALDADMRTTKAELLQSLRAVPAIKVPER